MNISSRLTSHNSQFTIRSSIAAMVLASLGLSSPAMAQSPFVGARATGMAGAAVAVSDDGTAMWTNPAGFARDPRLDAEILAGGVATNRNDFTGTVDRLSGIDFTRLTPAVLAAGVADLRKISTP